MCGEGEASSPPRPNTNGSPPLSRSAAALRAPGIETGGDVVLGRSMVAAALAGEHRSAPVGREGEDAGSTSASWTTVSAWASSVDGVQRQQAGVARTGAGEPDVAGEEFGRIPQRRLERDHARLSWQGASSRLWPGAWRANRSFAGAGPRAHARRRRRRRPMRGCCWGISPTRSRSGSRTAPGRFALAETGLESEAPGPAWSDAGDDPDVTHGACSAPYGSTTRGTGCGSSPARGSEP